MDCFSGDCLNISSVPGHDWTAHLALRSALSPLPLLVIDERPQYSLVTPLDMQISTTQPLPFCHEGNPNMPLFDRRGAIHARAACAANNEAVIAYYR